MSNQAKQEFYNFEQTLIEQHLEVEIDFYFPQDQIYTKTDDAKSKFRIIDVDNRIKSALDAAFTLFENLDDKQVFKILVNKKLTEREHPWVRLVIKKHQDF